MQQLNYMHIGFQLTIERHIIFLHAMVFCSITKVLEGETFVTKKITKALCRIKLKNKKKLYLGNIYKT